MIKFDSSVVGSWGSLPIMITALTTINYLLPINLYCPITVHITT